MFKRVLIANRGEIAIRIARAAAALGVESVAVYAVVDALSLHTRVANASHALAGDGVRAYLDVGAVVGAAVATGCDCVHPGYGFLAESAEFARACHAAGIAFIGPQPDAIDLFGDKLKARALARSLGIPVVPGSNTPLRSADEAIQEYARRITIRWPAHGNGASFLRDLQRTLQPFRGGKCEVCIQYASASGEADLTLGERWSVRLTRELRDQLTRLLGDDRYLIHYPRHFV